MTRAGAEKGAAGTAAVGELPDKPLPPEVDPSRVPAGVNLRRHAARGSLVNSVFQVGFYGLGTAQRLVVAAWLTRSEYGIWGITVASLVALTWIKQFGIGDKYIQQSEHDQEAAFQKAFTLEVGLSLAFFVLACVAMPIYGIAYGRPQIVLPGIVLALSMPLSAFETPSLIAYRRLQWARQRWLTASDALTTVLVSISLVVAGLGYWGLIIGALAGSACGGFVCTVTSPYRVRLRRVDRSTISEYFRFSWPLVATGLCGLFTLQGLVFVANQTVGLAGLGAIGLAGNITSMSDGVDAILSQTIYPVACAVADRADALAEAFVKSNRLALMWALPAMVGVALFAGDLVHFVLGDRWRPAVGLFAAVALAAGFAQVGYNWAVFLRATNNTRPILVSSLLSVGVFLFVSVPAIIVFGLTGYAIGVGVGTAAQILCRAYYMGRLFRGFSAFRQLVGAVKPTLPAVALVLLIRIVEEGHRSLVGAILELAVYGAAVIASTFLFERSLVSECIGYLRGNRVRSTFSVTASAPVQSSGA